MQHNPIDQFIQPPTPANDIPMIIMVGPQVQLQEQRALHWRLGLRFLGFRHGDTALLALLTTPCDAVLVTTPADMTASAFVTALREDGYGMPSIILGGALADAATGLGGEAVPTSAAALRALLVRLKVLQRPMRRVS